MGAARRGPADRRLGARRAAAAARCGADHGADADRLGRVRGRPRRSRDAFARAAVGDPAPCRGARQQQRPLVGSRGQHVRAQRRFRRARPEACASGAAFEMRVGGTTSIALAKPLAGVLATSEQAILLLAYPKAEALADARKLQLALAVMTLLGLILVAFATWRAAGRITQPLARLDEAAGRLAAGEHVQVRVRGDDELARLATSFNDMVGKIVEREQRITQLAFNDVLTGLPNRTMFQQQLEHLFRAVGRQRQPVRAALPRPRPVQGHQRHARPPGRRRAAGRGRPQRVLRGRPRPFRRAARRRRVRRAPDRRRGPQRDRPARARDSRRPWPSRW